MRPSYNSGEAWSQECHGLCWGQATEGHGVVLSSVQRWAEGKNSFTKQMPIAVLVKARFTKMPQHYRSSPATHCKKLCTENDIVTLNPWCGNGIGVRSLTDMRKCLVKFSQGDDKNRLNVSIRGKKLLIA